MSETVLFHGGPLDGVLWETLHASPVEHLRTDDGDLTYSDSYAVDDEDHRVYEWEPGDE